MKEIIETFNQSCKDAFVKILNGNDFEIEESIASKISLDNLIKQNFVNEKNNEIYYSFPDFNAEINIFFVPVDIKLSNISNLPEKLVFKQVFIDYYNFIKKK